MIPDSTARGTRVRKARGYEFHGIVVAAFEKLDRQVRFVVESTTIGAAGMLHIYSGRDLELEEG